MHLNYRKVEGKRKTFQEPDSLCLHHLLDVWIGQVLSLPWVLVLSYLRWESKEKKAQGHWKEWASKSIMCPEKCLWHNRCSINAAPPPAYHLEIPCILIPLCSQPSPVTTSRGSLRSCWKVDPKMWATIICGPSASQNQETLQYIICLSFKINLP